MKLIIAFLIFSILVIFHEIGHLLTAKLFNIKVNEFWVGMGPTLLSFGKGETKYCLKAIPFGGACVMESDDTSVDDSRSFNKVAKWKRAIVIVAGPAFNIILAYVFALIVVLMIGVNKPIVNSVMDNYPAEVAGISAGDEILKINNYRIRYFNEISIYNFFNSGKEMKVTYLHNGKKLITNIVPVYNQEDGRYLLGLQGLGEYTRLNIGEALLYGAYEVKYQIYSTLQSLRMLFGGQVGVNDLSGPVGIVSFVGDVYEESSQDGYFYLIVNMLSLITMLSANIGLMNLLPFPALDGGKIIIYLLEFILRRELPENVEAYINAAGVLILMAFMVFITASDVMKFF